MPPFPPLAALETALLPAKTDKRPGNGGRVRRRPRTIAPAAVQTIPRTPDWMTYSRLQPHRKNSSCTVIPSAYVRFQRCLTFHHAAGRPSWLAAVGISGKDSGFVAVFLQFPNFRTQLGRDSTYTRLVSVF